ncbi:MAG: hypothetical protein JW747_05160 [Candidatus Aminicenantes bacterium]|nr:hypothetical protein [Candidatus Aminicenantes bacterium]
MTKQKKDRRLSRKVLIVCVSLLVVAACSPAAPPREEAAVQEFDWPLSGLRPLDDLLEYKPFHLNEPVLLSGIRPEDDKPINAAAVLGKKTTDRDWVFEDGPAAVWVSGIDGPDAGEPIVLAARLRERNGALSVEASLILKIGQPGRTVLRPGEHVYFDLPGNKSVTCPIELDGGAVAVVHHNEFEYVVLKALEPGTAKLRIFSKWWNAPEKKIMSEHELAVE